MKRHDMHPARLEGRSGFTFSRRIAAKPLQIMKRLQGTGGFEELRIFDIA